MLQGFTGYSHNCVKTGQVKGPHCVVPGLPGAPVGPGNGAFLVMAAGGPCFFMCWARTGLGDTGGLTDLRGALSVTWPSRSALSRRGEFSGCSCGLGCSETVTSDIGRLLMVPVPFSYGTGICPSWSSSVSLSLFLGRRLTVFDSVSWNLVPFGCCLVLWSILFSEAVAFTREGSSWGKEYDISSPSSVSSLPCLGLCFIVRFPSSANGRFSAELPLELGWVSLHCLSWTGSGCGPRLAAATNSVTGPTNSPATVHYFSIQTNGITLLSSCRTHLKRNNLVLLN